MMFRSKTLLAFSFASLALTPTAFAEDSCLCPDKVRLTSAVVAPEDVPPGFTPLVSGSIVRLSGVSVFDGPPEEGAMLKPTSSGLKGRRTLWTLSPASPQGTWISCDYAQGLIRLVKPIGTTPTSVTALIDMTGPTTITRATFTWK